MARYLKKNKTGNSKINPLSDEAIIEKMTLSVDPNSVIPTIVMVNSGIIIITIFRTINDLARSAALPTPRASSKILPSAKLAMKYKNKLVMNA